MSFFIVAIAPKSKKIYTGESQSEDELLSLVARATSLGATTMCITRRRKRENTNKAKE